jgi:probable rRNA maturation factor
MTYNLDILNDAEVDEDMLVALETAVNTSLSYLSSPPTSLSLLLTDDKRLRQLNRDFRQTDSATDVLSFPANEPLPNKSEPQLYLGDIAISVPYAHKQAQMNGHSLVAELQLLAIHGVLHLLGYDHLEQTEKEEMWSLQELMLTKLGLHDIAPSEA